MSNSDSKNSTKFKYNYHLEPVHILEENSLNDSKFRYMNIRDRIKEIQDYFTRTQSDLSNPPASESIEQKTSNHQEVRHLDSNFITLIWIHDQSGIEHNIFREHFYSIQHKLPFQGNYHRHNFIEIFYVVDGCFEQILLGEQKTFSAGEVVITDKNCEHADYITKDTGTVVFLWIRSEFLDQLLNYYNSTDNLHRFLFQSLREQRSEQSFLHLKPEGNSSELEFILEQLVYEDYTHQPGSKDIIQGNLLRMFHLLCEQYALQVYSSKQESKEKVLLYEIERYINLHLSEVTINDLEKHFHYHRNYYNLLLRRYRNQSFKEYVQSLRMNQASRLLNTSTLTIKQIAEQVGYTNTSFFYHLFEKYFGMSPMEYRNTKSE